MGNGKVEAFLSRLQGKVVSSDKEDNIEWMDAKKDKFSVKSFYFHVAKKNGRVPYECYLEYDGYQSRVKGFNFR